MIETYTAQQKFDAIMRELKFRARVYERKVAIGQMTQAKADYEEGVMRAIAEDYRIKLEQERSI